MSTKNSIVVLLVDDDADERLLAQDALKESRLSNELYMVENGEEVLNFL